MHYIKPGKYYKDAHRVAAATLWSERKYFIHSLGHGIGTIIHEHPRISPKGKWVFKENMCITVEPGVYHEGKLGIRIEDTCLVTKNACISLIKSTKKLLCF
jgi:Xaa-Pro aminopeptidase